MCKTKIFGNLLVVFIFIGVFFFPLNTRALVEYKSIFTRDLESGMTGSDVKELQKYLNSQGFFVAPAGEPGSPQNETERFGAATFSALKKFQAQAALPASGYFGPMTRNYIFNKTQSSSAAPIQQAVVPQSDYEKMKTELFNEFRRLISRQNDANMDAVSESDNSISTTVTSLSNSTSASLSSLSGALVNVGAVPLVTATGALGESAITDDGSTVTVTSRNMNVGNTLLHSTAGLILTPTVATASPQTPVASGNYYNNSTGGMTFNLPTITSATVGIQMCFRNYVARTGAITLDAPASTYIDVDGVNGTAGGTLVSAGSLGDAVCVAATSVTQYVAYIISGFWTNN